MHEPLCTHFGHVPVCHFTETRCWYCGEVLGPHNTPTTNQPTDPANSV